MNGLALPVAALIAAYVATHPLLDVLPGNGRRERRAILAGLTTAILGFIFLGIPEAWPALLFTGGIVIASTALEGLRPGPAWWLGVRIATLLILGAIGAWLVPALHDTLVAGEPGIAAALLWPPSWYVILIVLAGAYVTVEWGRPWVERAIEPFAKAVSFYGKTPQGLPNGGRMIGRLERLLIYLFVLIDAPTAIGFLVTAKSILRFGEVKDKESHRLAEYIIIGTLMSFGFAIVSAYLVRTLFGIAAPG